MKLYTPNAICQKCGHGEIEVSYHVAGCGSPLMLDHCIALKAIPGEDREASRDREHFFRRCKRCSFPWVEVCPLPPSAPEDMCPVQTASLQQRVTELEKERAGANQLLEKLHRDRERLVRDRDDARAVLGETRRELAVEKARHAVTADERDAARATIKVDNQRIAGLEYALKQQTPAARTVITCARPGKVRDGMLEDLYNAAGLFSYDQTFPTGSGHRAAVALWLREKYGEIVRHDGGCFHPPLPPLAEIEDLRELLPLALYEITTGTEIEWMRHKMTPKEQEAYESIRFSISRGGFSENETPPAWVCENGPKRVRVLIERLRPTDALYDQAVRRGWLPGADRG